MQEAMPESAEPDGDRLLDEFEMYCTPKSRGTGDAALVSLDAGAENDVYVMGMVDGVRTRLTRVLDWRAEVVDEVVTFVIRTAHSKYLLLEPTEQYQPFMQSLAHTVRFAAALAGILRKERRVERFSFDDAMQKLAAACSCSCAEAEQVLTQHIGAALAQHDHRLLACNVLTTLTAKASRTHRFTPRRPPPAREAPARSAASRPLPMAATVTATVHNIWRDIIVGDNDVAHSHHREPGALALGDCVLDAENGIALLCSLKPMRIRLLKHGSETALGAASNAREFFLTDIVCESSQKLLSKVRPVPRVAVSDPPPTDGYFWRFMWKERVGAFVTPPDDPLTYRHVILFTFPPLLLISDNYFIFISIIP